MVPLLKLRPYSATEIPLLLLLLLLLPETSCPHMLLSKSLEASLTNQPSIFPDINNTLAYNVNTMQYIVHYNYTAVTCSNDR